MTATWYYAKGEQKFGPFTDKELLALLGDGKVQRTDMVWKEGMKVWIPIPQVVKRSEKAPPPIGATFFYKKGDKEHGPFTSTEIVNLTRCGTIAPDDLVWKHGEAPATAASLQGQHSGGTSLWQDLTPKSVGQWILVLVLSPAIIMLSPLIIIAIGYWWWSRSSESSQILEDDKKAVKEGRRAFLKKMHKRE